MKPIAQDIHILIKKLFNKHHPFLAEILINWSKIVGSRFSSVTSPVKITRSKDKGKDINILLIYVENSSISVEFVFQQEIIIERIAVYLGSRIIDKIKIVIRN